MLIEAVKNLECIMTNILARNSMFSPRNNFGLGVSYFFGEKSMKKLLNNDDLPLYA
jgi:hypothetical protein